MSKPKRGYLIVEDEPHFARVLEVALRQSGRASDTAPTGVDALTKAILYQYDGILIDLRLPDSDGLRLITALRAAQPNATIIMMTAYEREVVRFQAVTGGADAILFKPFKLEQLDETIRETTENRKRLALSRQPYFRLLHPGLELQIEDLPKTGPTRFSITATVVLVSSDKLHLHLAEPIPQLKLVKRVQMTFISEAGLFRFQCRIASTVIENPNELVTDLPKRIHRIERRRSPRITIQGDAEISRPDSEPSNLPIKAKLQNLSTGGMAIVSSEKVQHGENINVRFQLSPEQGAPPIQLLAAGRVIRVQPTNNGAIVAGIQFIRLTTKERRAINQVVRTNLAIHLPSPSDR